MVDEDAYQKLERYLNAFKGRAGMGSLTAEMMDELEQRIADIFVEHLSHGGHDVVDAVMVDDIIHQLGMPDGSPADDFEAAPADAECSHKQPAKKLYRSPDLKSIGGVCGGISVYSDVDVTLIRILFLIGLICSGFGFVVYVILWIAVPLADTAVRQCEMHGLEPNSENISRFNS